MIYKIIYFKYLQVYPILVIESKLYACPRCGKDIKSIGRLIKRVNACKITNSLPYYQSLNPNRY